MSGDGQNVAPGGQGLDPRSATTTSEPSASLQRDVPGARVTAELTPGSSALTGLHTFSCLTAQDQANWCRALEHTRKFGATRKTGDCVMDAKMQLAANLRRL